MTVRIQKSRLSFKTLQHGREDICCIEESCTASQHLRLCLPRTPVIDAPHRTGTPVSAVSADSRPTRNTPRGPDPDATLSPVDRRAAHKSYISAWQFGPSSPDPRRRFQTTRHLGAIYIEGLLRGSCNAGEAAVMTGIATAADASRITQARFRTRLAGPRSPNDQLVDLIGHSSRLGQCRFEALSHGHQG